MASVSLCVPGVTLVAVHAFAAVDPLAGVLVAAGLLLLLELLLHAPIASPAATTTTIALILRIGPPRGDKMLW